MKNTLLVVAFFLVLSAIAFFVLKPKKEPDEEIDPGTGGAGSGSGTNEKTIPTNPMPLKIGSGHVVGSQQNQLVKDVQTALNKKHGANLVVDGKFGAKTLSVLVKNGYGGVIYWKQYAQITGKKLMVDGKEVTI